MGTHAFPRRFRHAAMRDYERIQRIYAHARALMAANGNPTQWGNTFPLESTVRRDIVEGRTMLLIDSAISSAADGGNDGNVDGAKTANGMATERILAQFALCPGEDPTYCEIDGSWLDDDPYVTIHRIASSGLAAHVAYDCIEWVAKQYGNVRADTHPNNKAMQHVLERSGFARCGLISLPNRGDDKIRIAYQRHDR